MSEELEESPPSAKNSTDDLYMFMRMQELAKYNDYYKNSPAHDSLESSENGDFGVSPSHMQFLQNNQDSYGYNYGESKRQNADTSFQTPVTANKKPLIVEEDDSMSDGAQKPAEALPGEGDADAPVYERPAGVGETVREGGGRAWKRDEIWKQVKAANAGQTMGKAPAKDKRGFGDHLMSFGKGLGSFGSWLLGSLFTGIGAGYSATQGWREGKKLKTLRQQHATAQASGADPLALKAIEDKIVNKHYSRLRYGMDTKKRGRHASGYQWRKRLGWLTKKEQAEIQAASGFDDPDIKATWRDARDNVQNRGEVTQHSNSIKSGVIDARAMSISPEELANLEKQQEDLNDFKPKNIAEQRQKLRNSRALDAKIRASKRGTMRKANFDAMSFGDDIDEPRQQEPKKPVEAPMGQIVEEDENEASGSENGDEQSETMNKMEAHQRIFGDD